MIAALIRWSVANRFIVVLATLVLAIAGALAVRSTPVDALPDLSDVQVVIRTPYPGQGPQIVENQVTYPLTTTMMSVPGAKTVRGYSMYGDSYVYVLIEDGSDLYWASSAWSSSTRSIRSRPNPIRRSRADGIAKPANAGRAQAEINGKPRLMCMTRLDTLDLTTPVRVEPMRSFPHVKDLVTDVSWNYRVKKQIKPFRPRKPDAADGSWRMQQVDVDSVQEFRKCIECFLCQNVCHVLREHHKHPEFAGPRHFVYTAALEMHPLDTENRLGQLKDEGGLGYCNIPKCCTVVCPEHITITDNAIIPLKERVVDEYYDPVQRLVKMITG